MDRTFIIHKNRTVLAANEIAHNTGFEVGTQYYKIGIPESHRGCKANETLIVKNGQATKSE